MWPSGGIFLLILCSSGLLAYVWQGILFEDFKKSYAEIQINSSAQQAERISELLAQEIRDGIDSEVVQNRLQESLIRNPFDEAGFLCRVNPEDKVLCHPKTEAIGIRVKFQGHLEGFNLGESQ